MRFGPTSEAGLNDGFAFRFHLAIALVAASATVEPSLMEWLSYNVFGKIGAGMTAGYAIGRAFGWLTFDAPVKTKLAKTGHGLIALSATFVSYARPELIHCYGLPRRLRHGAEPSATPIAILDPALRVARRPYHRRRRSAG